MFLEKLDDQRCDLWRINMPERMNEGRHRRAFGRRINHAVRSAWFALCRATVEFPKLLDCFLLPGKTRQLIFFSAVMKNRTRFGDLNRTHQRGAAGSKCGKEI